METRTAAPFTCGGRTLALDPEPTNGIPLRAVAEVLMLRRQPVYVVLEPGDATMYCFLLCPHTNQWSRIPTWGSDMVVTVVRYISGHAVEADNFHWPYKGLWDLDNIGKQNEWTRTFTDWWLKELAEECKIVVNASANTALAKQRSLSDSYAGMGDSDVSLKMDPNAQPHALRVTICQTCVDAGFPDHGSDVPAEMGPRPCNLTVDEFFGDMPRDIIGDAHSSDT